MGDEALPENLRCNRTDGRQWRCNRRVMDEKKLCEIHYLQGRHRQHKQKVPDSLKLERKNSKKQDEGSANNEIRVKKKDKVLKIARALKRKRSASEALDEAVKKMKLKRGDLQLELIRVFLKRQVEKKKEKKLKGDSGEELTRVLPNGVMAISPSPSAQNFNNAGVLNIKIGLDLGSSPVSTRCFRSKNIEPVPISTMQILPSARNLVKLRKGKRKKCHWCHKSSYVKLIKCSSCVKQFFCKDCIIERHFDKQEVKMTCPVCSKTCRCSACSMNMSKNRNKEFHGNKVIGKVQQLRYLIYMLLPVLEKISKDQLIGLDMEAKIKGRTHSELHNEPVELDCKKQHFCNVCNTSIVDVFRSCPNCSYDLCLSCCREFCEGGIKALKYLDRRKGYRFSNKFPWKMKSTGISEQSSTSMHLPNKKVLEKWKAFDDGRIPCPPLKLGGCGDSLLTLRHMLPFNWVRELEVTAEEMVYGYEGLKYSDVSHSQSQCKGSDHKACRIKQLHGLTRREDSSSDILYYPTLLDLRDENHEHFLKHWAKGHPVVVRNVLQSRTDLNWDPVVMFCSYLEKSCVKYRKRKEAIKSTNCLDWCEVEIGSKQIFMGSLEGRTQANMQHEIIKLKVWLSSCLFEEQFPVHFAEIIQALPLQEYMHPISGILNLAVKLPMEMQKPELGPCLYISYGGPEDLVQADFLTKLCYNSHDVVNILAHATNVTVSTEQLARIKTLMRKYNSQGNSETVIETTGRKMINEMNGKTSLDSEETKESGLRDMVGEALHLPSEISTVALQSDNLQKDRAAGAKSKKGWAANKYESEYDSDASILCSGTIESFDISEDWNFFQDDIESSSCSREKLMDDLCGAQWDIFSRQDVPKLLEYLRKHSNEFNDAYCFPKQVVHPILDQNIFLDAFHKMRLKEEFNIEPWTFEQHVGEAVIIPAGCPYQIKKLKVPCVNVVLEFISPENVTECIDLMDERCQLPVHHIAKGKVSEVKKMALYGVSAAIDEIRKLAHVETGDETTE